MITAATSFGNGWRWVVALACGASITAGLAVGANAVRADAGPALAGRLTARLASPADVTIERQDFEGTAFPPPGWIRFDDEAHQNNQPDQFVWSRETCDVWSGQGGQAAAWAVGDGALGGNLACGAPYPDTATIDSWLVYGPIDARLYPGGLNVTLDYKLDEPRSMSFIVCATIASAPGFACYASPQIQVDWSHFGPMRFPDAAGISDAEIWIIYRDRDPLGTNNGVFIDNVVIEGISSAPSPTPTGGGVVPTPTKTVTPSATATATATSVPPTATASRTATTAPPTSTRTLTPVPASPTPSRTSGPPTPTPSVTRTATPAPPSPTGHATATATYPVPPTASFTPVPPGTASPTGTTTPERTPTEGPPSGTPTATRPGTGLPPPETITASPTQLTPTEASPTVSPGATTPTPGMPDWAVYLPLVMDAG